MFGYSSRVSTTSTSSKIPVLSSSELKQRQRRCVRTEINGSGYRQWCSLDRGSVVTIAVDAPKTLSSFEEEKIDGICEITFFTSVYFLLSHLHLYSTVLYFSRTILPSALIGYIIVVCPSPNYWHLSFHKRIPISLYHFGMSSFQHLGLFPSFCLPNIHFPLLRHLQRTENSLHTWRKSWVV